MVRVISIFLIFIFIGCEMNSKQLIKPEKFQYNIIKFDAVSKTLNSDFKSNSTDHKNMSKLIEYWFDNRVKTDGFDGNLLVNVKQIQFDREKKENYYKFSVSVSLEFIEKKSSTNIKTYVVNSKEYGESSTRRNPCT